MLDVKSDGAAREDEGRGEREVEGPALDFGEQGVEHDGQDAGQVGIGRELTAAGPTTSSLGSGLSDRSRMRGEAYVVSSSSLTSRSAQPARLLTAAMAGSSRPAEQVAIRTNRPCVTRRM
jgi:hypothetical protein